MLYGREHVELSGAGSRIRIRGRLLGLLLVVVVWSTYSNAPLNGFVWDDHQLVVKRASFLESQALPDLFWRPFFPDELGEPTRAFFRPLVVASFVLDWALWRGLPTGFHIANVCLHVGVVLLVYLLALRFGTRPFVAALAAAVFGVLPRLTEAVTWISGRTDVLAAFFVLLALVAYRRESNLLRRCAVAAMLLAGLLSKETAVAGVLAVLVLEVRGGRPHEVAPRLIPVVVVGALYATLRLISGVDSSTVSGFPIWGRVLFAFEAVGRYAVMLMTPWSPRTHIGYLGVIAWPYVSLGVTVAIALLVAGAALRRSVARILPWAVLAGVPFLLVMHIAPIAVNVVAADRFLYLPSAAIAALSALFIDRTAPRLRICLVGICLVSLPFLAFSTLKRNEVWRDDLSLWSEAVRADRGRSPYPVAKLAEALVDAGKPVAALALADRAIRIENEIEGKWGVRGASSGRSVRAQALFMLGEFEEAERLYLELASERPEDPLRPFNAAVSRAASLRLEEAQVQLEDLGERFPAFVRARSFAAKIAAFQRLHPEWSAPLNWERRLELQKELVGMLGQAE